MAARWVEGKGRDGKTKKILHVYLQESETKQDCRFLFNKGPFHHLAIGRLMQLYWQGELISATSEIHLASELPVSPLVKLHL